MQIDPKHDPSHNFIPMNTEGALGQRRSTVEVKRMIADLFVSQMLNQITLRLMKVRGIRMRTQPSVLLGL